MVWLGIAGGYVAGLVTAIFFVLGFMAKKKVEDTGKLLGKPKEYEPFRNQSREAMLEQVQNDPEAWER